MYYNNMNGNEDDLEFIPLNITEPFRERDSTWFPIIDMALAAFNEMPNSFTLSFATPTIDNSNLQGNNLNTLDYIQSDNINLQNKNNEVKSFEKNFNLEYPSETISEELTSYNKDDKCKKATNNANIKNKNNNTTNTPKINPNEMNNPPNAMNNPNTMNNPNSMNNPNTMNNPNSMNNPNVIQNMNMESMINRQYIEEPIHMDLLRNLSFEGYLTKSYRGEEESQLEQVDMIFASLKKDNSIIDTFKAYNIPSSIYELIAKKIIKLTLDDSNCKRGE